MLFICTIDQVDYPFALVQPYDAPVGRRRHKDKDLGLWQIRAKSRSDAEFVPLCSIVRGAAMAPDYEVSGDFFLIDTTRRVTRTTRTTTLKDNENANARPSRLTARVKPPSSNGSGTATIGGLT
ncbi:hypothetical protein SERLA73DRAFT_78703 [Serpula lacrymans var. lacrymans S7.3]|uniref:Uncharacterized protein n=1 Tax=Serpula lacrymans var. lacrymans (strain S7.3) TaxID=936435 RepID=F8QE22_SERL3|nr:hypothetical protein SERLA73DRAFT_78703 [Serpula lacrymans var. lacrymans S7.3]